MRSGVPSTLVLTALFVLFSATNADEKKGDPLTDPLHDSDLVDSSSDIVPGAYIVEWETEAQTSASFYRDLGLDIEHRLDLNFRLFKGVSFRVLNASYNGDTEIARRIGEKPEVKGIWPVRTIHMPTSKPITTGKKALADSKRSMPGFEERQDDLVNSDTLTPHIMTQVDKLRAESFTGKGIRIGIVNSGVDYTHPALGGCFGEGCLVSHGWDLTGDNYFPPESPAPDPDPYDDCVGHGTHVAGIIAAQANEMGFTGAAPDVVLGMYRAWGCSGLSTSDILLDGFNGAYEDGSNIISCSAGQYTGWANDPWAIAASRIVAQGVPVIVSPGNSGRSGMFLAASSATGVDVTAVGSVDNGIIPLLLEAGSYNTGNDTADPQPFGLASGAPKYAENITLPLWAVSNDTISPNDACGVLPDDTPNLSSKVVLRVADTSKC
ncbi:subtilisin-like serine protease PR1C [Colletotrichum tofieldiae]|nr:subtilisin-like serine protease PR1C [Colletotrichum tofieldiae]GKT82069.1 subtilisin-like serine protease PR1C [Colletotrichum tofieldiae]